MKKKQLKRVTKRIMKEILAEEQHNEIFELLSVLAAKMSADNECDFKSADISQLVEGECSKKEVVHIHDCAIVAIKEELKKEHSYNPDIRKEHSFYITTRLMIALWELDCLEHMGTELLRMNNREKFCYEYVRYLRMNDPCLGIDKILTLVSYLD